MLEKDQKRKPTSSHMNQQPLVSELNHNFQIAKKDIKPNFIIQNTAINKIGE